MKSTKNNIESEVIKEFEKIKPALTRLLQSESNNNDLILRLGKTSTENSNEVTINQQFLLTQLKIQILIEMMYLLGL